MIEAQTNITQNLIEALTKTGHKIAFMPDVSVMDAIRFIEEKGIPNNKKEDYKYCNIEVVFRKEFKLIKNVFSEKINAEKHKLNDSVSIFIINGAYNELLSDKTTNITVNRLEEADKQILDKHLTKYANVNNDAFVSLNTAFCSGGIFIHIKGIQKKPIHIINISSAKETAIINPRQLIVAEANSQATIIESFLSENNLANVFNNHLSEVFADENAHIKHYKIQNEDIKSYQINTTQVCVKKNASYTINTFTFNGSLIRNNLNIALAESFCETHLNGLYVTKGSQLVDNHTLVDHQKPNCESNELYKGIAKDHSIGVFNGKIFVHKHAQKTNAYQSSKNILLSNDATINTKPQLEIYADDVKCSHGTSTGKIDESALFYLKSRGIGDENAKKLLLTAFAGELIEKIEFEPLKEKVQNLFEQSIQ